MKRTYRKEKRELPLDSGQMVRMLRDNLHQFAKEISLFVAQRLLEEEVE